MNYLFIFSIGPVQSFIAQARKTQDLYAGSQILSKLTKEAIKAVGKKGRIVFPCTIVDNVEFKSLPNRFVAKFENINDSNVLDSIGKVIECAVRTKWEAIAKEKIAQYSSKDFRIFADQINNHFDINWLFYPIGENYETSYREAESLLGAVKNVRVFNQNAEKGRKCSIDGERNVKFYRLTDSETDKEYVRKSKLFIDNENEVHIFDANDKDLPLSILAKGEGLSAVSFVKRAYRKGFPSTAEVALMSDKVKLDASQLELLECYEKLFDRKTTIESCVKLFLNNQIDYAKLEPEKEENWNDDFDYQRLFEENIVDKDFPNVRQRQLVKTVFAKLQSYFKQKYYATLVFDGDKMGEIMGGGFLIDKDNLEYFQSRVSKLLGDFAQYYAQLEPPKGKTVYAGGDDYLGFVNLEHLFYVMKDLRESFDKRVNQEIKKEFSASLSRDFNFTFSAGIAIAHYKTPLSIVLQKARDMQNKAKHEKDRNAFCMAVLKHSGESHEAGLKWEDLHLVTSLWKNLSNKNYSGKFITSLQREFGFFKEDIDNNSIDFFKNPMFGKKMLKSEIGRLLKRSKSSDVKATDVDIFTNVVYDIFDNNANKDFNNFSELLNIVEFMKRKTKTPTDNDN